MCGECVCVCVVKDLTLDLLEPAGDATHSGPGSSCHSNTPSDQTLISLMKIKHAFVLVNTLFWGFLITV